MPGSKVALLTGITGQDGSYLAELLLSKGYEVHGVVRRSSSFNTERIDHIYQDRHIAGRRLHLHYGDLSDASNLSRLIEKVAPDEVYNLGAQSHVMVSFEVPEYTADVDALGALRLLDAVREAGPRVRYYQASSSELYGRAREVPQRETTPFYPRSPYAIAKLFAYWSVINYREAYGLFAVNGILFNHESPRRGKTFVSKKVTRAAARIALGLEQTLYLGNLDARRDWGYAPEYVAAMWLMLQQPTPEDYVIATGVSHSVRELVDLAFAHVGIPLTWQGGGVDEQGLGPDGKLRVAVDPAYFRPAEVDILLGDASKAKAELGWEAQTSFAELVRLMVDADLAEARNNMA